MIIGTYTYYFTVNEGEINIIKTNEREGAESEKNDGETCVRVDCFDFCFIMY